MNDYKLFSDIGFECIFFIKGELFVYHNEELNAFITVNKNGWSIEQKSPITNVLFKGLTFRQQKKVLKEYDLLVMRLQSYNSIIVSKGNKLSTNLNEQSNNYINKEEE